MGSIPGQGTKIPHVVGSFLAQQKKKKKTTQPKNKVLLNSTGNYIQCPEINPNGQGLIYIIESLCRTTEINTTLEIHYTSIKKKKLSEHIFLLLHGDYHHPFSCLAKTPCSCQAYFSQILAIPLSNCKLLLPP